MATVVDTAVVHMGTQDTVATEVTEVTAVTAATEATVVPMAVGMDVEEDTAIFVNI